MCAGWKRVRNAMSRDDWERALARAAVERGFRARLLADPVDTLADYGLRDARQSRAIESVRARTLGEFAARVLHLTASAWSASQERFALEGELF